jgi:hypothetical protein
MANMNMEPGPGRPKGVPNKATGKAREAIAQFVDGNVDRLNGWLDAIAAKDPKQAFDCFMSVIEYNIPKLQRQTIVGDPDAPFQQKVLIEVVKLP